MIRKQNWFKQIGQALFLLAEQQSVDLRARRFSRDQLPKLLSPYLEMNDEAFRTVGFTPVVFDLLLSRMRGKDSPPESVLQGVPLAFETDEDGIPLWEDGPNGPRLLVLLGDGSVSHARPWWREGTANAPGYTRQLNSTVVYQVTSERDDLAAPTEVKIHVDFEMTVDVTPLAGASRSSPRLDPADYASIFRVFGLDPSIRFETTAEGRHLAHMGGRHSLACAPPPAFNQVRVPLWSLGPADRHVPNPEQADEHLSFLPSKDSRYQAIGTAPVRWLRPDGQTPYPSETVPFGDAFTASNPPSEIELYGAGVDWWLAIGLRSFRANPWLAVAVAIGTWAALAWTTRRTVTVTRKVRQMVRARELLLSAFNRSDLEQLTKEDLDKSLDEICGNGPLGHVVFQLVWWSFRHGRFEELLAAAAKRRPNRKDLGELAQEANPSTTTVQPPRPATSNTPPPTAGG